MSNCCRFFKIIYSTIGGITMKQDYEKPELIVYEDLSDVTMGISMIVLP